MHKELMELKRETFEKAVMGSKLKLPIWGAIAREEFDPPEQFSATTIYSVIEENISLTAVLREFGRLREIEVIQLLPPDEINGSYDKRHIRTNPVWWDWVRFTVNKFDEIAKDL